VGLIAGDGGASVWEFIGMAQGRVPCRLGYMQWIIGAELGMCSGLCGNMLDSKDVSPL